MKSTLLVSICFIGLILFGCSSNNSAETTIRITHKTHEPYFLLSKLVSVPLKKYSVIDSIYTTEKSDFHYYFDEEPGMYQLKSIDGKKLDLAINVSDQIHILKDDSGFTVDGSPDTDLLQHYEAFRKESLDRLVLSVRREVKALTTKGAPEELIIQQRAREVLNYGIHLDELTGFISKNLKNSLALVPTSLRWNSENLAIYEDLTASFKNKYGAISATQQLENKIELLKKTKVGAKLPVIELKSKTGVSIASNSVQSELTLIDFWASWCPPCRVESKLLNEIYSEFSRDEFNIYGISLDTKREKWEAALEKDGRIWNNVSSLKGLKTQIAMDLGITSLPFNFLIDKQGEILASNIHGEELQEFISGYLEAN